MAWRTAAVFGQRLVKVLHFRTLSLVESDPGVFARPYQEPLPLQTSQTRPARRPRLRASEERATEVALCKSLPGARGSKLGPIICTHSVMAVPRPNRTGSPDWPVSLPDGEEEAKSAHPVASIQVQLRGGHWLSMEIGLHHWPPLRGIRRRSIRLQIIIVTGSHWCSTNIEWHNEAKLKSPGSTKLGIQHVSANGIIKTKFNHQHAYQTKYEPCHQSRPCLHSFIVPTSTLPGQLSYRSNSFSALLLRTLWCSIRIL